MALGEVVDLQKIPYLNKAELNEGRFLASLTFYDDAWHMWASTEQNKFVEMRGWPAEAFYFGKSPEKKSDLTLGFLDFMSQHASFIQVKNPFAAIQDDLLNLSAAFAKIKLIFEQKHLEKFGGHRMAATEVEYILFLCRGIFDFLEEIVSKLWDAIKLTDEAVKKRQLKKSFADMVLKGGKLRTAEELTKQFGIPSFLAECYVRNAPVFVKIREYRDNLVHRGSHVQIIFRGEKEFVIEKRLGPFLNPNIWRDDEVIQNDLVPLLPALGLVVHGTLAACEEFAAAFMSGFRMLDPIVPGMHLYLRGYFNETLIDVLEDADQRVVEGRGLLAPESSV